MWLCRLGTGLQKLLDKTRAVDFMAPLLLRLYLAPIFWVASNNKWNPFDPDSSLENTIAWFGNPDWGLGLPFPEVMAYMAWGAEYFGSIFLILGLAVRWVSIPLMVTMIVAATTVHWQNGWQAIHDKMSPFASDNVDGALERLGRAKSILQEHGNYDWLTEHGNFVVLNNGIEFAATYFVMLLALFFIGGGKYLSVDYWVANKLKQC
ncbi:DoxX family protein [Methylophaga sp. OBS4]|uniref:HvfX family Cu-binding RiPP maturation protein n=1 Tax=Methylophaga sp. OBS4 TaxID=2991935 RepID=UPI00225582BA|nr:DoxX family protein [Methylophaga sp. OBS4]MCX4188080.1 DoxX family protein [Methylophaga sp. OBS4]